jgi:hypothetical protein
MTFQLDDAICRVNSVQMLNQGAYKREPKSFLGQIFNFKLGCFGYKTGQEYNHLNAENSAQISSL